MQFIIPNRLNSIQRNVMRQCGYFENYDKQNEEVSYIRSLGRGNYPRFHIYIKISGDNLIFNIHIDQKQASYKGYNAHSAEYDSEIVRQETARVKQILSAMIII